MARVSALNLLASPEGTTGVLRQNYRDELLRRALAAQQAQEGIATARTQRAALGAEQGLRGRLLELEQARLNQQGALGFGGLDLQAAQLQQQGGLRGRELDLQKTLGEGRLGLARTGQEADIAFREGGTQRQLDLARGLADIARETRPAEERFRESLFEGLLQPAGVSAAVPTPPAATGVAAEPRMDLLREQPRLDGLDGRGVGPTPPRATDLLQLDEARDRTALETGARGPRDGFLAGIDPNTLEGQLVFGALGVDPGQIRGTPAFEESQRGRARERRVAAAEEGALDVARAAQAGQQFFQTTERGLADLTSSWNIIDNDDIARVLNSVRENARSAARAGFSQREIEQATTEMIDKHLSQFRRFFSFDATDMELWQDIRKKAIAFAQFGSGTPQGIKRR
jgi:hypothetical protein